MTPSSTTDVPRTKDGYRTAPAPTNSWAERIYSQHEKHLAHVRKCKDSARPRANYDANTPEPVLRSHIDQLAQFVQLANEVGGYSDRYDTDQLERLGYRIK